MRLASIVVLAGAAACGERAPPVAPAAAPVSAAAPAPSPVSEPLELAISESAGAERAVRWTEALAIPKPTEDVGAFAYARRKTALRADGVAVGWLEPGARVGVAAVTRERVEVVLFAWRSSSLRGPVRAWADPRDLGPAPPRDAVALAEASRSARRVRGGQSMRRLDGAKIGYTFCGDVEVLGEDARGIRAVQREDGVALEVLLEDKPWAEHACPGLLVLEEHGRGPHLVYHGRSRAWRGPGIPPGLVASGPFDGPTFAQLAGKRARIYWMSEDPEAGPSCQEWQLEPPKRGSDDGALVSRMKLPDGDTLIVRYGLRYATEAGTDVTLLGPSSEVIAPPGQKPRSGGVSFGCGVTYRVVASDGSSLVMHRYPPSLGEPLHAYDPRDTERWYKDRASCEREALARRRKLALAFDPHRGC